MATWIIHIFWPHMFARLIYAELARKRYRRYLDDFEPLHTTPGTALQLEDD